MTKLSREKAKSTLLDHHSSQEYYPQNEYPNVVHTNSQYLGSYIPYIGKSYFDSKPRVLMYAMVQNLARASGLVRAWLEKPDKGLLRQYYDPDTPYVHVYPYDNGHLKVIAALTLDSHPETRFKTDQNIDDMVVITNFVKFSFYREDRNGRRLDANPPSAIYDDMWEYYCKHEVSILRPDIIIGVGNEVANAVARNLQGEHVYDITVLRVPFPGRLNLNSRWVPKGRDLIKTKNYDPTTDVSEMQDLVKGTPDVKGRVGRAIKTDWYYFRRMKVYISEQLAKCT